MRKVRARTVALIVANTAGAVAFVWPFVAPGLARGELHESDAPWFLLLVLASLVVVLFVDLDRGMGPKTIALLGVLGAAMVALRLPGFVAGFSAMFIVVLLGGNAFGSAFGFLLGAVGTFASGLFVGGLGPWLPFQMVAVGWMGAGAGAMPNHGRRRVVLLAAYGFVAGYAFGAVMNLWSWPFIARGTEIGWVPEEGMLVNLRHYAAYYAATSFGWDTFRAVGNAALVLALGHPVLRALDRAARRMRIEIGRAVPPPELGRAGRPVGERDDVAALGERVGR
ncbi:MAG: ECF transporter S component [Actinomycetota bacterium]